LPISRVQVVDEARDLVARPVVHRLRHGRPRPAHQVAVPEGQGSNVLRVAGRLPARPDGADPSFDGIPDRLTDSRPEPADPSAERAHGIRPSCEARPGRVPRARLSLGRRWGRAAMTSRQPIGGSAPVADPGSARGGTVASSACSTSFDSRWWYGRDSISSISPRSLNGSSMRCEKSPSWYFM